MKNVTLRGWRASDALWLVRAHRELYAVDEGFDDSFGDLVAEILTDFDATHDPKRETAIIAVQDNRPLGSIFCVRQDDETAKLRLFMLLPEARGLGLGARLLQQNMEFARQAGYRKMVLWTHESHEAACALYKKTGWKLVRSEPKRNFGVEVVEQGWEISL